MRKLFLVLALVLSVSTAVAAPFTFKAYTDYGQWLAALPVGADIDAFGPGQSLGELAVGTTTGSFGPPQGVFPAGTNVWNDRVTVAGGEITSFYDGDGDFATPFMAFGGYWDFSPAGWGQGLTLTVINSPIQSTQVMNICGDVVNGCVGPAVQTMLVPDGTWFGIIAINGTFTSVSISADGQPGVAETFDLSQFQMVHVPEPVTCLLVGCGLLGLGLLRKVRS